jgi:hypothetical protein
MWPFLIEVLIMILRVVDCDDDFMEFDGESSWDTVSSAKKCIVSGIKRGQGQSYLPWSITDVSDEDDHRVVATIRGFYVSLDIEENDG